MPTIRNYFFIQYTYADYTGVSPVVFHTWEDAAAYAATRYAGMRDVRIMPTKG